jgi:glutaredoxin 3|tara:strand:+ start:771 stop:998 length:228 start_codon:yes stop_codon:yes gene_type:complete
MIEIYGKTFCSYCDKAKALCEREGYEYKYKQLDEDFTREGFFDLFPTARTFPQIKINGDSIGGYIELEEWSTNKE